MNHVRVFGDNSTCLARALAHSNDASERANEKIECFAKKKFKEGKSRLFIYLRPSLHTAIVEKAGLI